MWAFALVSIFFWLIIAAVIFWFGGEPISDIGLLVGTIILAPLMAAGMMFYYTYIFRGGVAAPTETKSMRRRRRREAEAKRQAAGNSRSARGSSGSDERPEGTRAATGPEGGDHR
ncbi:MAG: hypothetical protein KIS96_06820 [Bauldia sp.]|nr:hypothetical protein [Bauldia sp.]